MLIGIGGFLFGGDKVTLSGEATFDSRTSPTDSYARIRIDNDGNVYESADSGSPSYSQVDTATDWLRPAGNAPGLYEVRFTSATNTPTFATATEDTWHSLSSGDFTIYNSETGIGTKATTFTIEIRHNGGSVLASASYTLTAFVESGV
jgi:hypothetical protein